MNRIFDITTASERVSIGGDGRGEITFTVTNSSRRPLRGQLRVRPLGSTKGEWLNIAGETERAFSPNATQQVIVKIATPPGAPAGKYQLRLDAISVINPDDDFTEGPTINFEVKETEAPKKPFPWWIIAAAAALVLIVTLSWWYWPRGIEIPEVVGLNVGEATKKLEDSKFKVEVKQQVNALVGPNLVFAQEPQAKESADEGATITLLATAPTPTPTPDPGTKAAFEDNFDGPWKEVWSVAKTDMTPGTRTRFLGPFYNETIKLVVENLPAHKTVTVKFDLYIISSWDGETAGSGPDVFGFRLEESLELMRSSFTNLDNVVQKFACKPDEDLAGGCFSRTSVGPAGAAQKNTLGFASWLPTRDAVYKIKRSFAHNRSFLILNFFSDLKEALPENKNINNEAWGLDNVRIEVQ